MPRRRKEARRKVPPPIEADAWYDRADLRLLLPWLGDDLLAKEKRDGRLRFTDAPQMGGARARIAPKHLYRGRSLIEWLEAFETPSVAGAARQSA